MNDGKKDSNMDTEGFCQAHGDSGRDELAAELSFYFAEKRHECAVRHCR